MKKLNAIRGAMLGVMAGVVAPCLGAEGGAAPDFGPNVIVFDQSMSRDAIQQRVDSVFSEQEQNQFGSSRYALLFKPGHYQADVQVGFYTSVMGLGQSPDDVSITGAVRSTAGWMRGNATCNFWRSVENLSIRPTGERNVNVWAVSQGAGLRRLHVRGNLKLWDGGWSSGGFLADSQIDGYVESGSQQQWISRNVDWGNWRGGLWNMVFVGVTNPPEGNWPQRPYTVVSQTPVIREKPFLTVDQNGSYQVVVPSLHSNGSQGRSWASGSMGTKISIDQFLIAQPGRDTAATINDALTAGKNVLMTPGVYHLDQSIHVTRPDAIILGIGYPTLIPDQGTPSITVANVDGVKIGGIIFDAGANNSPALLQVGQPGDTASHEKDPTFLYDIVARTGGATAGKATTFVTINSNHVVGDNLWLWRADHGEGAAWDSNPNAHGIVVNGNDVTCYGLFVEHCEEFQTLWNGNGGRVYFYQSEMPYDPPSQAAWSHDGIKGYASYKVADQVKTHEACGLGIYSYFMAAPVVSASAIEAPDTPGVRIRHMVTIRLGGKPGSGIEHILGQQGPAVINTMEGRMK